MIDLPRWSTAQILDPNFRKELTKHVCDLHGHIIMEFTDGDIEVSIRMGFLNLFWLDIVPAFGIPLCKRHFINKFKSNNGGLMGAWTKYYDEIMNMNPTNAKKLKLLLWDRLNELYVLCSVDLLPYTQTLDILDIADIMTDPKIESISSDLDKMVVPEQDTRVVEKYIDQRNKELLTMLETKDALPHNALYPFRKADQLNAYQLPQMLLAYGPRTDVNDTIVRLPVRGNAVWGLHNACEYSTELLSAKKSAFYNHDAVTDSQYFGRKQSLLASNIRRIYAGDCGSKILVKFNVTDTNYANLVGKNVLIDGKLVCVTKDQCKSLIGQTIEMRSPLTCRYRCGVCEVCGGAVFRNINRKLNIGILSAIHVIEPTTQKILSSKHLIKTASLMYEIPRPATAIIRKTTANDINWTTAMKGVLDDLELGVAVKDFPRYHDVVYLRQENNKPIKEELFSKLRVLILRNTKTKEVIEYDLGEGMSSDRLPYFSSEFLLHIRDMNTVDLVKLTEGKYWIPLKGTYRIPIMRFSVVNDNMLMFVKRVSRFLCTDVRGYHSCSLALQAMSDIIHSKVSANIVHLEVLLKGYMINSPNDFGMPSVTNPDDVHFGTNASILANRTVGTQLGFENLARYMSSPSTYLTPKMKSPFDLFVGYTSY